MKPTDFCIQMLFSSTFLNNIVENVQFYVSQLFYLPTFLNADKVACNTTIVNISIRTALEKCAKVTSFFLCESINVNNHNNIMQE